MAPNEDLGRIATAADAHAAEGEAVTGVLPVELPEGERVYLCAFGEDGARTWLALGANEAPIDSRELVRAAVSIAAFCELAEDTAAGGDLDELRAQLVALRLTDDPPGLEDVERAVEDLQRTIGQAPRLASPAYLDAVGAAARRLEQLLDGTGASPFAAAMRSGAEAVEALTAEVERGYKLPLQ